MLGGGGKINCTVTGATVGDQLIQRPVSKFPRPVEPDTRHRWMLYVSVSRLGGGDLGGGGNMTTIN